MKRAFLFIPLLTAGLSAVLLLSCRKEQLRVIDDPAGQPLASCSNGVYDGDEQDLDCGGSCTPCASLAAPCSPVNNSVNLANTGTYNYSSTIYCDSTSNSWFEIEAYTPDIRIELGSTPPMTEKVYYINSSSLSANDAQIYFNSGFSGTYNATSGKIYVKRVNGKVQVTFCSVEMANTQSSQFNTTASGKLTCN